VFFLLSVTCSAVLGHRWDTICFNASGLTRAYYDFLDDMQS